MNNEHFGESGGPRVFLGVSDRVAWTAEDRGRAEKVFD